MGKRFSHGNKDSNFRSLEMELYEIYFQSDSVYDYIAELGELGIVQFKDSKYVNKIRMCNEMERRLHIMETEMEMKNIKIPKAPYEPGALKPAEMDNLNEMFLMLEKELVAVSKSSIDLKKSFLDLTQMKHVLSKTDEYFVTVESSSTALDIEQVPLMEAQENLWMLDTDQNMKLGFTAGVILQQKIPAFEQMLWRISRGNLCLQIKPIETPLEDPEFTAPVFKSVFIVFYQGEELKSRVNKVCEGFRATVYICPDVMSQRVEMYENVLKRIEDIKVVINKTDDFHDQMLRTSSFKLKTWFIQILKMKSIYCVLDMFNVDVTSSILIAECWIPVSNLQLVHSVLTNGGEDGASNIPPVMNRLITDEEPPTYNKVDKYTKSFQLLVDAYGFNTYGEINPAPFAIITFPFLFAIMFGDVGHGIILLLIGVFFAMSEGHIDWKEKGEILNIFYNGRYMLVLMGIFSIYTGFMYNECFSRPIIFLRPQWKMNFTRKAVLQHKELDLNPEFDFLMVPYPIGMDPVWQLSINNLSMMNSFKMKLAIIFGITHMLFGIFLSLSNYIYFQDRCSIIGGFLPHVLFLSSIFLYMIFLIFFKWTVYGPKKPLQQSIHCAPSILTTLIMMCLMETAKSPDECDPYMFPYQYYIQICLLSLAGICIPWMFFFKPLYIIIQRHGKKRELNVKDSQMQISDENKPIIIQTNISLEPKDSSDDESTEDEQNASAGQLFIYEAIHTIEYILGCVSHTASYLRLWALSLAHTQLSQVLWNMVFRPGLRVTWPLGSVTVFVAFAVWAIFTMAILVLMEGLSAFLHTLRLHWVEFQSKFYKGLGYAFIPFSFRTIIREASSEDPHIKK